MKTLPKGHRSIYDPAFRYIPAMRTDVAATFARIKAERAAAHSATPVVTTIRRKT